MPEFLTRRQGFWHFVRRVPETFAALDRRGIVKRTTHIRTADDPRGLRATRAAALMNGELDAYWQGLSGGRSAEAKARCEAARKRARQLGFSYMPAAEVNHAVPHVVVRADGRLMKTEQSAQELPLVGVALMAAQTQPEGFPRYRDKAASRSAITNKVMRTAGLLPLPGQSAYSFRHCFEDRLTAVEAPEKLIAAMMGHKYQRQRYGSNPSLAQQQEWLKSIAFNQPY